MTHRLPDVVINLGWSGEAVRTPGGVSETERLIAYHLASTAGAISIGRDLSPGSRASGEAENQQRTGEAPAERNERCGS